MSDTTSTTTKGEVRIFIDDRAFFAPQRSMTGAALLALAELPPANQLFLEVNGPVDDKPIGPSDVVHLHSGMKFYDVPVGTFG
jgi:hypothetical protein